MNVWHELGVCVCLFVGICYAIQIIYILIDPRGRRENYNSYGFDWKWGGFWRAGGFSANSDWVGGWNGKSCGRANCMCVNMYVWK